MYQLKIDGNGVVIKTGLPEEEIIFYTEVILHAYNLPDTMANRITAKKILDSLVILETQLRQIYIAGFIRLRFLPTLKEDFSELFGYMNYAKRNN